MRSEMGIKREVEKFPKPDRAILRPMTPALLWSTEYHDRESTLFFINRMGQRDANGYPMTLEDTNMRMPGMLGHPLFFKRTQVRLYPGPCARYADWKTLMNSASVFEFRDITKRQPLMFNPSLKELPTPETFDQSARINLIDEARFVLEYCNKAQREHLFCNEAEREFSPV